MSAEQQQPGTPAVYFHLLPSFIANEQRGNGDDSGFNQNAPSVRRRRAVQVKEGAQEDGSCAQGYRHAEELNWCRENAPKQTQPTTSTWCPASRLASPLKSRHSQHRPYRCEHSWNHANKHRFAPGHSHPHRCPISEGKMNGLLIFPRIYGASVSHPFTINLWLRQSGCRETESWRERGYLSQLPALVAVQWLRLGSAEEEERAVMGLRGSRGHRLMAEGD